jgi:hypothetical protein
MHTGVRASEKGRAAGDENSQAPYEVGGSVTASPGIRVKTQVPYAVGGSVTASPGTRSPF